MRGSAVYSMSVVFPATVIISVFMILLSPIDIVYRVFICRGRHLGPVGLLGRAIWFRWIFWTHRIRLDSVVPDEVKNLRGVIFASNHQSLLDIPALFSIAPRDAVFLAKKELFYIPFFGIAAWLVGTQFIDRSRGASDPSVEALNGLLKKGISVILFPEGTRSTDGQLLPFKRGAAVMALRNQVPLVPVAIEGSQYCLPKSTFALRSGTITIRVGEPLSLTGRGFEDRHEVTTMLRESIAALLTEIRKQPQIKGDAGQSAL